MAALMATAEETLAQAHRAAQLRNAAIAGWILRRRWVAAVTGGLIPERLLADLIAAILTYRGKSGLIAARYGSAARQRALGGAATTFTPRVDVPLAKLEASLSVVGLQPGDMLVRQLQQAKDPVLQRELLTKLTNLAEPVSGAGMRHVTDAGRDTIKDIVRVQDKDARGYVRVVQAGCCYFCAMLASRGPVYSDESFDSANKWFRGDGPAKAHDNCNCSLAPVYGDAAWPAHNVALHEAWRQQPGAGLNEWRKFYDETVRDTLR